MSASPMSRMIEENWIRTCKRMKLDPYLTPLTKVNSKWIKDLNIRPETIKYRGNIEENIEKSSLTLALAMIFLDKKPKAKATKAKINKWGYVKLKSFLFSKGNHQQNEKAAYRMRENICKSYI